MNTTTVVLAAVLMAGTAVGDEIFVSPQMPASAPGM